MLIMHIAVTGRRAHASMRSRVRARAMADENAADPVAAGAIDAALGP
ncbi:hypothetical protein [Streptomyces sp. ML-6]|nr:hypothetical protein [Streptomyces sp. ML-6]MDK0523881.1 hypothetical protein [Streptomyces sp. ML-6]